MKRGRPQAIAMVTDFKKYEKRKTNKYSTDLDPRHQKIPHNFVEMKTKVKECTQKQNRGLMISRNAQKNQKKIEIYAKIEKEGSTKKDTIKKQKTRKPKDILEVRQRKQYMKKIESTCEEVIMLAPENTKYFSKSIYSKILENITPGLNLNFNLKQDQKKSIECNLIYNILRLFKWDKITNFLKKSRQKVKMLKISTFQEYILKGKMFENQSNKGLYKVTIGMLEQCLQKLRNRQYVYNELLQKKVYIKLYSSDKNQYLQKMIIFIYKIIQFTNFVQKYLKSNVHEEQNIEVHQEYNENLSQNRKQMIINMNSNLEEQKQVEEGEGKEQELELELELEQEQENLMDKQEKMPFQRNQKLQNMRFKDLDLQKIQKLDQKNIIEQLDQMSGFNEQQVVSKQKQSNYDTRSYKQLSNPQFDQGQNIQDQIVQNYLFDLSNDDMPFYKILRLRSIQIQQSNTELNYLFSTPFQIEGLMAECERKEEKISESPTQIRQSKISQYQQEKFPGTLPSKLGNRYLLFMIQDGQFPKQMK